MITLVLGGARSGKSAVAEQLCGTGPVVYVATATVRDSDMRTRVAAHQARRPGSWSTVEAGADLASAVRSAPPAATVLIDSLTAWLADLPGFAVDAVGLCAVLASRGDVVVVSDEVGLGVHPSSEAGRVFRDRLGELNQAVAAAADRVLLVVAGRVLPLERP